MVPLKESTLALALRSSPRSPLGIAPGIFDWSRAGKANQGAAVAATPGV